MKIAPAEVLTPNSDTVLDDAREGYDDNIYFVMLVLRADCFTERFYVLFGVAGGGEPYGLTHISVVCK